jgi:hypothetical protein
MTEQSINEYRQQFARGDAVQVHTAWWGSAVKLLRVFVFWGVGYTFLDILSLAKKGQLKEAFFLLIISLLTVLFVVAIAAFLDSFARIQITATHFVAWRWWGKLDYDIPLLKINSISASRNTIHIWYTSPKNEASLEKKSLDTSDWTAGVAEALATELATRANLLSLTSETADTKKQLMWSRSSYNVMNPVTSSDIQMSMLKGGLLCILFALILWWIMNEDKTLQLLRSFSLGEAWFDRVLKLLGFLVLAVTGVILIFISVRGEFSRWINDLPSCTWNQHALTVTTRRAGETIIPWCDIQSITLPPDPTSGTVEIQVTGHDEPLQIPLASSIRSLLLIARLKEMDNTLHLSDSPHSE